MMIEVPLEKQDQAVNERQQLLWMQRGRGQSLCSNVGTALPVKTSFESFTCNKDTN